MKNMLKSDGGQTIIQAKERVDNYIRATYMPEEGTCIRKIFSIKKRFFNWFFEE